MKHLTTAGLFAAMVFSGGQAFAADSDAMPNSSMSHMQMMKSCMAEQKAKDSSMSKDDMKKACKTQMRSQHSTPNQMTPTTGGQPDPATGSKTTPPTTPPK